jgi:hypothetical protein
MMDIFSFKRLKNKWLLVLQLFTTQIFTTKRGTGNKFNGEKKRGILVFREEEDIAPIIQFIGSNRLAFQKV